MLMVAEGVGTNHYFQLYPTVRGWRGKRRERGTGGRIIQKQGTS